MPTRRRRHKQGTSGALISVNSRQGFVRNPNYFIYPKMLVYQRWNTITTSLIYKSASLTWNSIFVWEHGALLQISAVVKHYRHYFSLKSSILLWNMKEGFGVHHNRYNIFKYGDFVNFTVDSGISYDEWKIKEVGYSWWCE